MTSFPFLPVIQSLAQSPLLEKQYFCLGLNSKVIDLKIEINNFQTVFRYIGFMFYIQKGNLKQG